MRSLVIGTRGSDLARWQADFVRRKLLEGDPNLDLDVRIIRTKGDENRNTPLHRMADTGLFTAEIESQLLAGEVDLAVHSLKDLPTQLPQGLTLADAAVREDPADVLLSKGDLPVDELPAGATVFAGSLRRRAQLLHRRGDLLVEPIRGNVPTRLRKFQESDAHGMVMARAGLVRLGLDHHTSHRLDPTEFVPACGQGALAVEIRQADGQLSEFLRLLDDPPVRLSAAAERAFLAVLGGGCQVPAGAHARVVDGADLFAITGMIADLDGKRLLKETLSATVTDTDQAEALGRKLATTLRDRGGREILDDVIAETKDK